MIRLLKKLALPFSNDYSDILSIGRLSVVDSYRHRWDEGSISQDGSFISQGGSSVSQVQRDSQLSQSPLTRSPLKVKKKLITMASYQVANESPHLDSLIEDDPLHQYDSLNGVVRDSMYIRSRVLGLYITDSTFISLIQCRPEEEQSMAMLKRIITILKVEEPVMVEQSTLSDIEAKWTGNRREFQVHDNPQEIFQVLFTISAYVESDWSLTRELCYLAISESAKKMLYERVGVDAKNQKKRKHECHKYDGSTYPQLQHNLQNI